MMVLEAPGRPLVLRERPVPRPADGEVLLEVSACGVCRTDLHLVDGELPDPMLPVVPGHEIVGRVLATGARVTGFRTGDRVGVPWLASTCGALPLLQRGAREPVRVGPLHRLHARRRIRDPRARRCALRVPAARPLRRRARGAAAVRGPHRPSRMDDGGAGAHGRPLRVRRGGAPDRPDRGRRRPRDLRVHAPGRHRRPGARPRARRRVGRRQRRAPHPSRSTPRSCSRPRARSSRSRWRRRARAARSCARAST